MAVLVSFGNGHTALVSISRPKVTAGTPVLPRLDAQLQFKNWGWDQFDRFRGGVKMEENGLKAIKKPPLLERRLNFMAAHPFMGFTDKIGKTGIKLLLYG